MNHKDIIALWPSAADFAADMAVSERLVAVWKVRDSIPAHSWLKVLRGARKRGIELSERDLENG